MFNKWRYLAAGLALVFIPGLVGLLPAQGYPGYAPDYAPRVPDGLPGGAAPVYRMYSHPTGEHLYTEDYNEAQTLAQQGQFRYEGVSFHVVTRQDPGLIPLYRLERGNGAHLLATDFDLERKRWWSRVEKTMGYVAAQPAAGWVPLYEWEHPTRGQYLYTLDRHGEAAPAAGYQYAGIVGYVLPPR